MRSRIRGEPLIPHSLVLANHSSWLDILILGGAGTAFVSKSEIAGIPMLGWLADQNQTLYIARSERGGARDQIMRIRRALNDPKPLTVFPEGTTGDGRPLLPFRSTLLAAVAPPPARVEVRPVAIDYGRDARLLAWIGGEPALANVIRILGLHGSREVTVYLLAPLEQNSDRKALARAAQEAIATALSSVNPRDALGAPTR
ncbi:MAG TPA: lysophospholipid acyltransferase family protein [Sphingomicrobium sp.]|nr:lysophospholipid acyltransferase family protein [Sphingomicrobium sp.]